MKSQVPRRRPHLSITCAPNAARAPLSSTRSACTSVTWTSSGSTHLSKSLGWTHSRFVPPNVGLEKWRFRTCLSKVLRHCSRAGAWSLTDWAAHPGRSARSRNPWQPAADPGAGATAERTTGVGGFVCWNQRSGASCTRRARVFWHLQ